jgi:hypothetical protein
MPYVRRNWKGEITDIYSAPQIYAGNWEKLSEDDPEIIAFQKAAPKKALLAEHTWPKNIRERVVKGFAKASEDEKKIKAASGSFAYSFGQLESSLSELLQRLLGGGESKIGFAIYFSPTSFEARSEIVGNTVIQLASEQAPLKKLIPLWATIAEKIDRMRRLRNAIAHGHSSIHITKRGVIHTRWSPPAFDIIRLGGKRKQGQIPGLSIQEIEAAARKLFRLRMCVDCVGRLVREWQEGNPSLQEKFAELNVYLAGLDSPEE